MNQETSLLWRFTPVASPNDPTWQGRKVWSYLEIVAATSGEAILLAARYEETQAGRSTVDSQDHQQLRSGFEDERLYRVDRLEASPPAGSVAGQVIGASTHPNRTSQM
jgi:hypothetical protein